MVSGHALSFEDKQQMAMEQMQKQAELNPQNNSNPNDQKQNQENPAFQGKLGVGALFEFGDYSECGFDGE